MCILNGDGGSECRVSDLIVTPKNGERDLNMESSYEFGARIGYWRILEAFTQRNLAGTINLVGLAGEMNPHALEGYLRAGFDIQPHGWRWIDYSTLSEDEEREHIRKSVEQVVRITGQPPLGYYAGLPSLNTRRLVVEAGTFSYDSDSYCDELPYWVYEFGQPHLVLPYSLDTNDSRFARAEGYQLGEEFFQYVKDSFDVLYAEGTVRPRMMTIGLHARLLGRPGRIGALHKLLDYIQAHNRVWICRRGDIALHWARTHPPSAS